MGSPAATPSSTVLWVLLSLTSHVLWGLHPVFSRHLQTKAAQPLDPVNLLAMSQLCALVVNLAFNSVRKTLESPPTASSWDWSVVQTGALFGSLGTARAVTNICSSRFTYAFNVQMVAMAGPFVTGLMSAMLIHERLPWTVWPALLVATGGEALVVAAQVGLVSGESEGRLGTWDFVGMALQFGSLFFSGLARIMMKAKTASLDPLELMAAQYVVCIIPGFLYSALVLSPEQWRSWVRLAPIDYAVFATMTLGIFVVAASTQVIAIRMSGPGAHASLQPIRLFSTVLGSALLLDEQLTSPFEGIGMAVVLVALGWYVIKGKYMGSVQNSTSTKPQYERVALGELDKSTGSDASDESEDQHAGIELQPRPANGSHAPDVSPLHHHHHHQQQQQQSH